MLLAAAACRPRAAAGTAGAAVVRNHTGRRGPRIPRCAFLGAQGVSRGYDCQYLSASIFHEDGSQLAGLCRQCVFHPVGGFSAGCSLTPLPGNTAIWGSSPGAATVMTLMAGSYGADVRLVAFLAISARGVLRRHY